MLNSNKMKSEKIRLNTGILTSINKKGRVEVVNIKENTLLTKFIKLIS